MHESRDVHSPRHKSDGISAASESYEHHTELTGNDKWNARRACFEVRFGVRLVSCVDGMLSECVKSSREDYDGISSPSASNISDVRSVEAEVQAKPTRNERRDKEAAPNCRNDTRPCNKSKKRLQ